MRCLTLADELRKHGVQVTFACSEVPGNLNDLLEKRGYPVYRMNEGIPEAKLDWKRDARQLEAFHRASSPVDWLIVDHYELDARWERTVKRLFHRLMVVDDLANRPHVGDLLLDQNWYRNPENRYDSWVPETCIRLLGPTYALLRPEFIKTKHTLRARTGEVRRVLVFFGGSDPSNETSKVVAAARGLELEFDFVVGISNPHRQDLVSSVSELGNARVHVQVENMGELMASADLGLMAGGSVTWERCCLSLPALVVTVADNQIRVAQDLAEVGYHYYLGPARDLGPQEYRQALIRACEQVAENRAMALRCQALVDGLGASRVCDNLLERTI